MSLFSFFSRKTDAPLKPPASNRQSQRSSKPSQRHNKPLLPVGKPALEPGAQLADRKIKPHARREQLYAAIRQSMTRAGVLSASYKFRVLSLDLYGDQFLVMMDVAPSLSGQTDKRSDIETLLIGTAKSLFNISVTSVYWRTDNRPMPTPVINAITSPPAVNPAAPQKSSAQTYEPIHEDEMAAFKQVLMAAATNKPAMPDGTGKTRSGMSSLTLPPDFEDTKIAESSAAPVLSATQYGDLK